MLGMARRDFEPRAGDVRAARHFAAAEASGWGVDPHDLEIVVGELAANAFRHAATPFTVSVCYLDGNLTIEVADGSRALPDPAPAGSAGVPPINRTTGRGLLMVEALVRAWGARSAPGGKVVWAELPAIPAGLGEVSLR